MQSLLLFLLLIFITQILLHDYYYMRRAYIRQKQIFGYFFLRLSLQNILNEWYLKFKTAQQNRKFKRLKKLF